LEDEWSTNWTNSSSDISTSYCTKEGELQKLVFCFVCSQFLSHCCLIFLTPTRIVQSIMLHQSWEPMTIHNNFQSRSLFYLSIIFFYIFPININTFSPTSYKIRASVMVGISCWQVMRHVHHFTAQIKKPVMQFRPL
jgi:hypothetical protein